MATMIAEVYDAFKAAGVDDDKARKAAEAIASYENRFTRIETDLSVMKWMIGSNLALTFVVLGKLFAH